MSNVQWENYQMGNKTHCAARFDGATSYGQVQALVPESDSLNIGMGDFAISLWFYREPSTTTNLRILAKGAGVSSDSGYAFFASDSQVTFIMGNGIANPDGTDSRRAISGNYSGTNQWTHVAVNVNRSGSMSSM